MVTRPWGSCGIVPNKSSTTMDYKCLCILVAYFYTTAGKILYQENPLAVMPHGKIEGRYATSYSNRIYSEFLSVPYAQPPVGDLRFKEPQPIQPWSGVWVGNFTSTCAQWTHALHGGKFIGQEDCLYNNVFVPKTDHRELLDVIVHIHGGALNFGSNTEYTGAKHLMDRDVVFVAINYRLGPLGFLSTEDELLPGNNGMKDQVAALKWVKENIKHFGGNPESITLTGLSAGGVSVHLHYFSPLSKGLFNAGISLSGTALCPWPLQENALKQTRLLAKAVGCVQESTADLINCLRQRPVTQICKGTQILRPWLYNPFSVFGVVVEKQGNNGFLTDHPYKLLATGKLHDLPWITSVVSHEGLYPVGEFLLEDEHLQKLEKDWDNLMPHVLHYEHTVNSKLHSTIAKKIKDYYFKGKPVSRKTKDQLIQVASDRLFVVDAEKSARLQAKANKSPTYFYYFGYESEVAHSFLDVLQMYFKKKPGVSHGDDLALIFNCPAIPIKKFTNNDYNMREILLNIWTSFARAGKPVVNGIDWRRVSNKLNQPLDYLNITSPYDLEMRQTEDLGNRQFWDSLHFQENEELFPTLLKDEL